MSSEADGGALRGLPTEYYFNILHADICSETAINGDPGTSIIHDRRADRRTSSAQHVLGVGEERQVASSRTISGSSEDWNLKSKLSSDFSKGKWAIRMRLVVLRFCLRANSAERPSLQRTYRHCWPG